MCPTGFYLNPISQCRVVDGGEKGILRKMENLRIFYLAHKKFNIQLSPGPLCPSQLLKSH